MSVDKCEMAWVKSPMLINNFPMNIPARELTSRITSVDKMFVLAATGIPQVDVDQWRLQIGGMVSRPITLDFPRLLTYSKIELEACHVCAGSAVNARAAVHRVANVTWGGVALVDLLDGAQPWTSAKFLWAYGLDHGTYREHEVDSYIKDIPLDRYFIEDLMVAYELNGKPLPPEHGYPARLIAPGLYGTNMVKWLTCLWFSDERAPGAFTHEFYNDPELGADGNATGRMVPVWEVQPDAILVGPQAGVKVGEETLLWGWAWSGCDVVRVEASTDGGATWQRTRLQAREHEAWQRFDLPWTPTAAGRHTLVVRATDSHGVTQPSVSARNAQFRCQVDVEDAV